MYYRYHAQKISYQRVYTAQAIFQANSVFKKSEEMLYHRIKSNKIMHSKNVWFGSSITEEEIGP